MLTTLPLKTLTIQLKADIDYVRVRGYQSECRHKKKAPFFKHLVDKNKTVFYLTCI